MTAPTQILPGASYLVTRRCTQRQYLLKPSKHTNDTFTFVLAVAARRYGMRVHAFGVMSNHYHLVVTDPHARLPKFLQMINALVARAMNSWLGRWESFWSPPSSSSAVRLMSPQDVVDKVAYVLANPVAAGLVRTGKIWPGAWSDPDRIGGPPMEIQRPTGFFAENGALPRKAELELCAVDGVGSVAEYKARVAVALRELDKEAERRFGRGFKGVNWVLTRKHTARPASVEPRRNLNPRIAARDPETRIAALEQRKAFVASYREARVARRAGDTSVIFPAGTYLLRVEHGVPCVGFA
jgi:REP element-mobilizing transposase RayT